MSKNLSDINVPDSIKQGRKIKVIVELDVSDFEWNEMFDDFNKSSEYINDDLEESEALVHSINVTDRVSGCILLNKKLID